MKNSSNYNIYSSSRRRNAAKRRNFVIACLAICMGCVIADIVFISMLLSKKDKKDTKTTQTTVATSDLETDASGNPISANPDQSSTDITVPPTDNTSTSEAAPKVQTVSAETRATNLATLQTNVSEYLSKQSGRFSMYYINMSNGETIAVNESTPFVAASSIKLAYNTYLYEKVADGSIKLDEKMAYNAQGYPKGDFEGGTGTIQNSADGTEYPLSEVSHLSITKSDNCATNMLLRRLGGIDTINAEFMKPISAAVDYRATSSYTNFRGEEMTGKNRTSSIDLAKYAEHLYKDYKDKPDAFQPLIDDLCTTEYNWGIPAGVSGTAKAAHKVGFNNQYGAFNDLGIVFASEDYVICVMTECSNDTTAHNIIGEVSKMVFQYVESNYA